MVIIGVVLVFNWPEVERENNIDLEKRSVFISYIELSKYYNGINKNDAVINTIDILDKIKDLGFNEVIVQVRSFSDAIYFSDIFPWSIVVSEKEGVSPGYDLLSIIIDEAKKRDISVVAWINPYRIRNNEDVGSISDSNPAYKYLGTDVVYVNEGIYFNPSCDETISLIVEGVRELINNYEVDGVLFDDYFYPDNNIDQKQYEEYISKNLYITKDVYNLNMVSRMIKEVYDVCRSKGIKFGVSPDGNLENNYNKVFADVKKWCSEEGYIDFIMPQVYYGFYNETKPFKEVVKAWEELTVDGHVELRIALAFYKIGEVDNWAKSGKNEWMENNDIIMREIIISRNLKNYKGFSLFRYDYVFDEEKYNVMTMSEIENMKKVLN